MKNKEFQIIKDKLSLQQTCKIVSEMDFIIGMRLHSLIFAASFDVPRISYQPKVDSFMKYFGNKYSINLATINFEELKTMINNILNNGILMYRFEK